MFFETWRNGDTEDIYYIHSLSVFKRKGRKDAESQIIDFASSRPLRLKYYHLMKFVFTLGSTTGSSTPAFLPASIDLSSHAMLRPS